MSGRELDVLDRLIAIRKWRNLSQGEVAQRMYVTRPSVSLVEARRRRAHLDFLEAYARAVGAEIGVWPMQLAEPSETKRPPAQDVIQLGAANK